MANLACRLFQGQQSQALLNLFCTLLFLNIPLFQGYQYAHMLEPALYSRYSKIRKDTLQKCRMTTHLEA